MTTKVKNENDGKFDKVVFDELMNKLNQQIGQLGDNDLWKLMNELQQKLKVIGAKIEAGADVKAVVDERAKIIDDEAIGLLDQISQKVNTIADTADTDEQLDLLVQIDSTVELIFGQLIMLSDGYKQLLKQYENVSLIAMASPTS